MAYKIQTLSYSESDNIYIQLIKHKIIIKYALNKQILVP